MSYNILSVVPGHNGSICFLQDGKINLYIEEERLSKQKYDGNPFLAMIEILSNYEVHELVLGGTHQNQYPTLRHSRNAASNADMESETVLGDCHLK